MKKTIEKKVRYIRQIDISEKSIKIILNQYAT